MHFPHSGLLNLELHKPVFVEGETHIDQEIVLGNEAGACRMAAQPLQIDVYHRPAAVVVAYG